MDKLKVFTSFSGIGSQEMTLRNLGINFEVVGICEVDRYALIAYDAIHNEKREISKISKDEMITYFQKLNIGYNFSTYKSEIPKKEEDIRKMYEASVRNKNYGDIRLIDPDELPDFDLFTYSFPCKNISVAGRREGFTKDSDTQSSLLWEVEKIINVKKPKYLMLENVKNIVGKANIDEFNKWIRLLDNIGYNTYWKILNGKDFGVPQNRERVIAISIRKDLKNNFVMPESNGKSKKLIEVLENVKEDNFYLNKPFYIELKPNGKIEFNEKYIINDSEEVKEYYIEDMSFKLPNQDISYCIDASYWKGTNIKSYIDKKRRQLVNDPLTGKIRRLTPLECWRVMGFSDEDFYKAKNAGLPNTKLYERSGRGIVIPMLEEIFKELFLNNS